MNAGPRWTDDRLDDLAGSVHDLETEFRSEIAEVNRAVAALSGEMVRVTNVLERQIADSHAAIVGELAADREARLKERVVDKDDRIALSDAARQDFLRFCAMPVIGGVVTWIGLAVFGVHP